MTDVAVYEGDYYIHTNICPGQNPDWKHYPQMTAAERDSARMTYFEPNDNYPNELYNHYWVRYIGTDIYFILNDKLRQEINESVRTICEHYGVELIELKDIDKKSGHPSVLGMQQIAEQVEERLRNQ